MDLSVAFLGTGGAVPSARRTTASVLVARGGERLLFDCGEGTQRQMQRSLGLVQVDAIYFTHFHADHFLGLPGLLKTYDLTERERPLTIYGPRGLRDLFQSLGRVIGRVGYKLDLVELEPGDAIPLRRRRGARLPGRAQRARLRLRAGRGGAAGPLRPRGGEAPRRQGRPRLRRPAARRGGRGLGRSGRARAGDGRVAPGPHRSSSPATRRPAGRRSRPPAGRSCSIHDASFSEEEAQRAADTGHSTVGQAAAVAREAEVKLLALVHISSRYHVGKVLEEAREVFEPTVAPRDFDLIEIPFPERGEPQLVANGAAREARNRPEQAFQRGVARRGRVGVVSDASPGTAEWNLPRRGTRFHRRRR